MTVRSYKPGPGTLSLGLVPLEVSGQIKNCRVEASETVDTAEAIPVLSGEELAEDDTVSYRFTLAGTALQDLLADGLVDWTWINRGTPQPFTFVPNDLEARAVTGTVRPIPMTIGGDVGARAEADFSWAVIGDPTFGDAP